METAPTIAQVEMTDTRTKARKVAEALRPYVDTLLLARAYAQLERERVAKIQRALLNETVYLVEARHVERGRPDERITDPRLAYLMYDDDAAEYHAKLNAIHLANGFAEAAQGYCPALCAEQLQREAEWALIEAAEEFFPGVTNDRLLCGTGGKGNGLETRQKYIDLHVGLVVTDRWGTHHVVVIDGEVARATRYRSHKEPSE